MRMLVFALLLTFADWEVMMASPTSNGTNDKLEERGVVKTSIRKFDAYQKEDPYTSGAGDLILSSLIAGGSLATMDYNKPPEELAKKMADALVPVISIALSLIPGVGPILGGLFSGIWSLASSLFGTPSEEMSPLEKLSEHMEAEFSKIRKEMGKMQQETIKITDARTHAKLKAVLQKTFQSELARNKYVCNKYAIVSEAIGEHMKNSTSISDAFRLEVLLHLHDCDNFLKASALGLIHHPEFADALWIPSVVTTMARVSFLDEVTTNRKILRMKPSMALSAYHELRQQTKEQFQFYSSYVHERQKSAAYQMRVLSVKLDPVEVNFCKIQQKLLYFDSEIYPYGVPQVAKVNEKRHLKLNDLNVTADSNSTHHIHVFFAPDVDFDRQSDKYQSIDDAKIVEEMLKQLNILKLSTATIVNCFTSGPVQLTTLLYYFELKVTFLTDKSYGIRVLYLTVEEYKKVYTTEQLNTIEVGGINGRTNRQKFTRHFSLTHEGNTLRVSATKGNKQNAHLQRFEFPTGYFQGNLKKGFYEVNMHGTDIKHVLMAQDVHPIKGTFVVESVEPVSISSDNGEKTVDQTVIFEADDARRLELMFLGFEFIVYPYIN